MRLVPLRQNLHIHTLSYCSSGWITEIARGGKARRWRISKKNHEIARLANENQTIASEAEVMKSAKNEAVAEG